MTKVNKESKVKPGQQDPKVHKVKRVTLVTQDHKVNKEYRDPRDP
ncbi:hypothetical protein [Zeaxanthinibacter enoshimensis]|nr:hypothetical protein [Zeaxanthinibacter enoshimensis]